MYGHSTTTEKPFVGYTSDSASNQIVGTRACLETIIGTGTAGIQDWPGRRL